MKKVYLAVLLLFFSGSAISADLWTSAKGITSLQVVEHGGLVIEFDSPIANPTCTLAGLSTLYLYTGENGVSQEGLQSMTALLTTAFVAGKQVEVFYSDTTNACFGRYVRIR